MKIQSLLSETFDAADSDLDGYEPAPRQPLNISISDLNSLQLRTLRRLAKGEIDADTANEKELDIIIDLQGFGLLDDEFEITDAGHAALEPAANVGKVPPSPVDALDFAIDEPTDDDLTAFELK